MPLHIRPVEKPDEPRWRDLWEQYNQFYKRTIPSAVTETTFTRFLDTSTRMYCLVATDSATNVINGFITYYPHLSTSSIEEVVYIHDLFVDPAIRNKGTGRQLIEAVYGESRKMEAKSVYWHTQYFNHVGQILYEKVAGRTDFVVYEKTL